MIVGHLSVALDDRHDAQRRSLPNRSIRAWRSRGLGIVLLFSYVERVIIIINSLPSEVYERGSGDQSRSSPLSRLVLSEDYRFAQSILVPLQSAQLDREAETQFVSSCGDLRDSSRGLFSTGYHIPRSIRGCRVDFMFRCAPYRWMRGWHTCPNVAVSSLVDFEFWSRSDLPLREVCLSLI